MKSELDKRVEQKLVTVTKSGPLSLYNYSNSCVYEKQWDEYTMAARGLVIHDDGRIIARPWPKFFNMGERPETMPDALPAETPELSMKYDGSLLVVFFDGERWRAVTRGCWENIQTKYANEWLTQNHHRLMVGYTFLFELVAPWNRIVVHYAQADMVLIGVIETESGNDWTYAAVQNYAQDRKLTPLRFERKPLTELKLDDPAIKNEEGFVARFSSGLRVKLKYKQYLYLHKIVTGLSVKGIWEILASGNEPDFSNVPDEFMGWYTKQRDKIKTEYEKVEQLAVLVYSQIGKRETRKDYAEQFTKHPAIAGALFRMLDGKPHAELLWKQVKPNAHEVFKVDEA